MELNYKKILLELEEGNPEVIEQRMWQPKGDNIEFLSFSINSILDFKKPEGKNDSLSIYHIEESNKYQLLILKKNWIKESFPFEPILIEPGKNRILGKVLQFNEITPFLNESEQSELAKLGIKWTVFVIKNKK